MLKISPRIKPFHAVTCPKMPSQASIIDIGYIPWLIVIPKKNAEKVPLVIWDHCPGADGFCSKAANDNGGVLN